MKLSKKTMNLEFYLSLGYASLASPVGGFSKHDDDDIAVKFGIQRT